MSRPHVEWERSNVVKYSNIARMKNGLRKTYFFENECQHDEDTLTKLSCPICQGEFECCQNCCMDFAEDDVTINDWEDLVCPDCLEQCHQCHIFTSEENATRNDQYPYELYCVACAESLGDCYDEPDELEEKPIKKGKKNTKNTKKTQSEPEEEGSDYEETDDETDDESDYDDEY